MVIRYIFIKILYKYALDYNTNIKSHDKIINYLTLELIMTLVE